MANYYGIGRTNYFKVKDVDAFIEELSVLSIEFIHREINGGERLIGFIDAHPDGGGFDFSYYDEEEGDYIEVNLNEVFAKHLVDGWVAILMEAGSEKHRYVNGWAEAFNSKGESKHLSLNLIYDLASDMGEHITEALY